MATTIKTGWLKDENGDKFAPKTLASQVQTSDGTLLEDKIQADIDTTKTEILSLITDKVVTAPNTAEVGQTIVVKEVDANGKPTAWEAANYQPRTHWTEVVEILPETTIEVDPDNGEGTLLVDFVLEANKPYTIKYNGVEYADCVGFAQDGAVYFGNLSVMDESLPATDHPFVLGFVEADTDGDGNIDRLIAILSLDGSTELTLSIKNKVVHHIDPKYIKDMYYTDETGVIAEVVLPETVLILLEDNDDDGVNDTFMLTEVLDLTVGEAYTINLNGVEYETVAQEFEGAIILGNASIAGVEGAADTGEPFAMVYAPDVFSSNGYGCTTIGVYTDGSATVTMSIAKDGELIHKIDNKYLDLGWIPTKATGVIDVVPETRVVIGEDTIDFEGQLDLGYASLVPYESYIVTWNNVSYECTLKPAIDIGIYYYLGNTNIFASDEENTGEPFAFRLTCILPGSPIFGCQLKKNTSTEEDVVFKIAKTGDVYNKIPKDSLPDDYIIPTDLEYETPFAEIEKAATVFRNGGKVFARKGREFGQVISIYHNIDNFYRICFVTSDAVWFASSFNSMMNFDRAVSYSEFPQSDFTSSDETSPSFIKGRSHYIENAAEILPLTTFKCTSEDGTGVNDTFRLMLSEPLELVAGVTYVVNWNGVNYEIVAQEGVYEGVASIILTVDDIFDIYYILHNTSGICYYYDKSSEVTMSITKPEVIHKLDEKFIPDTIQRVGGDVIITSSTEGGTKKFKLTVDDSGVVSATDTETTTTTTMATADAILALRTEFEKAITGGAW